MANELVVRSGIISLGGATFPLTQVSNGYTIGVNDYFVEATGGTFNITLPTASGIKGKSYIIKNSGNGIITANTTGGQTIDGISTQTLTNLASIQVTSDGTNWVIAGTSGTSGTSGTDGTSGTSGTSGTGFNAILQPANFRILTATGSSTNQAVAQPNITFDGSTLTITGNLTVTGTSSVVNSQNLFVQDPIILIAGTQTGTPILDSGFMFNRGTGATQAFIWDESTDEFSFVQTNDSSTVIGSVNISAYSNIRAGGATLSQVKLTTGANNGYILSSDSTGLGSWTNPATILSNINGVTGSGTVNYVPYWNSSNNLSSTSSIYISNNNVGIGTIGSYAKLVIFGANSVIYSSTASYGLSDNTNNGVVTTIYNTSETVGSYAGLKLITRNNNAKKWGIYNVSKGAISADLTFGHGDGDVNGSEVMRLTDDSNVGIGLTAINARLHVKANTGITGSTVFKVDGNVGELFTVTDSLTGSLMSVNDISGLPILEVFDDNTILMGDYQAPTLYSSTKSVVGIVTNFVVYQFVASLYTSVFFEYNVQNSTNLRAGTITGVWNSTTMQFTETSTMDIGSTTPITFDVVLTTISTVIYVQLRTTTTTSGWTIKSIIRSI